MTNKSWWLSWFYMALLPAWMSGQERDLFTLDASKSFANYLYVQGDYSFAADEYARIYHMNPADDSTLVRLSKIYRKLGQGQRAQALFERDRQHQLFGNSRLEREYLSTLLFQADSQGLADAISQTQTFPDEELLRIQVEHGMLHREWPGVTKKLQDAPLSKWKEVYLEQSERALAFRPKKPWLASMMSVVVPGSGKVYAKNTKEGITSFLFVAALGYQSYRAFHQRGSKSVAGWIYGSLGLGFYLGNIYGAQQSAKNYNEKAIADIYDEVDRIIYRRHQ